MARTRGATPKSSHDFLIQCTLGTRWFIKSDRFFGYRIPPDPMVRSLPNLSRNHYYKMWLFFDDFPENIEKPIIENSVEIQVKFREASCMKHNCRQVSKAWAVVFILGFVLSLQTAVPVASLQVKRTFDDPELVLVGIYTDTASHPNSSREIILYKQDGVLTGLWSEYFSEEKKGYPYGAYPLENVQLGSDGSLKFSVLWDMNSRRGDGRVRMHHYFTGRLLSDVIQGEFTSDWPSLRPGPIKAIKRTKADLKQSENEFVLARQRKASEYLADLDRVLKCQQERQKLPDDPIDVIGFWSKVGSNGEHEWGYDVVLFKVGDVYRGWIEDYSGLVGDGGIKDIMRDIQYDKGTGRLDFRTVFTQHKALLRKKKLFLKDSNGKEIAALNRVKSPPFDQVWNQFQELNVECE